MQQHIVFDIFLIISLVLTDKNICKLYLLFGVFVIVTFALRYFFAWNNWILISVPVNISGSKFDVRSEMMLPVCDSVCTYYLYTQYLSIKDLQLLTKRIKAIKINMPTVSAYKPVHRRVQISLVCKINPYFTITFFFISLYHFVVRISNMWVRIVHDPNRPWSESAGSRYHASLE